MTTLVPIDGTQASTDAAQFAARQAASAANESDVLLLYVAPSAKPVDLARGQFLLESMARRCRVTSEDVTVHTRLEVGDRGTRLAEVAEDTECDLVVVGTPVAHTAIDPRRAAQDEVEWTGGVRRPLLYVLPTGESVAAP